jgi:hypothetical protein
MCTLRSAVQPRVLQRWRELCSGAVLFQPEQPFAELALAGLAGPGLRTVLGALSCGGGLYAAWPQQLHWAHGTFTVPACKVKVCVLR